MPLEMADPEDDEFPRLGKRRNPWWRPAGATGRALLAVAALCGIGGLFASAAIFKSYLIRDARFRIAGADHIQATGLTEVSRADMLPVFGEDIGRNIFFVPLSERRAQLEAIPWVERATVMRLLPDQIRVSVVERQPVAFTRLGKQVGLVDASGVLLNMPPAGMAQHHYSFPVVTGIDPGDPLASRAMRMAVYLRLIGELDANNQHLSDQISEIDLTDPEDARVLMPEQGADILAHFGQDHFLERYQRYKAHIAEWRQQYPKLAAVDLRYEQQVVLEMPHGSNAVEPASSDSASNSAPEAGIAKPTAGEPAGNAPPASTEPGATAAPKLTPKPAAKPSSGTKAAKAKSKAAQEKAAKDKLIRELTAKDKTEKEKKKREAAQRAALNATKGKPTLNAHPAAAVRQGQ
jgi:cell division protein FtsQ